MSSRHSSLGCGRSCVTTGHRKVNALHVRAGMLPWRAWGVFSFHPLSTTIYVRTANGIKSITPQWNDLCLRPELFCSLSFDSAQITPDTQVYTHTPNHFRDVQKERDHFIQLEHSQDKSNNKSVPHITLRMPGIPREQIALRQLLW